MFDSNLTYGEIANFQADMLDMVGDNLLTDNEMQGLAEYWGED